MCLCYFKSDIGVEPYVTDIVRRSVRSDFAKMRCGVALLQIAKMQCGPILTKILDI